jgi:hypothetical protein
MIPQEYWNRYADGVDSGEFMCRFESRNPVRCVERHLSLRGLFYGLVRGDSWKGTFRAPDQPSRETVTFALLAYLEEHREAWEAALSERDVREAEARAIAEREAAERAEREALEREAGLEVASEAPVAGESPEVMEEPFSETVPPDPVAASPESTPLEADFDTSSPEPHAQ